MKPIEIDHERCTHCGTCATVCVVQMIDDSEDILQVRNKECLLCGHCRAACPENAIEIPSLNAEEFIPFPEKTEFLSPEKLLTFFRSRRSTRIYKPIPVEKEKIKQIIEAGRFAPTGGNRQPLRYVVINSPEKLDEIRRLAVDSLLIHANQMFNALNEKLEANTPLSATETMMLTYAEVLKEMAMYYEKGEDKLLWNAPSLIVIHVSKAVTSPGVDVGLSAMQMVLMAEALGLGTCFIGFVKLAAENSPELRQVMQIPDTNQIVTTFVTGYTDVSYLRLVSRNPARVQWL